jgi:thiosulfate reductase cytochrome b subunit
MATMHDATVHGVNAHDVTAHDVKRELGGQLVKRHRISTRVWHWINALAIFIMLMTGMMISNAHPHLYWGPYGANFDTPWFNPPHFPEFLTIPSGYNLSLARHWHLFTAWILAFGFLIYGIISLINRHFQNDLAFKKGELAPAHLVADIVDHAQLKWPTGEAALRYNVLQKIAYNSTLFILIPLVIITGLGLSPGFNAIVPIPDFVGGRSSARSLHFIAATGIAIFIIVHLALVVLAGPYNEIRSMITGRYRVPHDPAPPGQTDIAGDAA